MQITIDNATVTAAFRAAGIIENTNRDLFELDVAALRVFVEACLFGGKIVVADNYQIEHTEQRKDVLSPHGVEFVSIPENIDKKMRKEAVAHVHNMKLMRLLDKGLDQVFAQLDILFSHAWRNSEGFLVMNALGVNDKYGSKLVNAYRSRELVGASKEAQSREFEIKAYNRETRKVAQALSWTMVRTVYYRSFTKMLGGEYFPHPIRSMMNAKCILFDNHPSARNTKRNYREFRKDTPGRPSLEQRIAEDRAAREYVHSINGFFRSFWDECVEQDDDIFSINTFDVEMPPFLAYVLHKWMNETGCSSSELIETIFKVRSETGMQRLREILDRVFVRPDIKDATDDLRELIYELSTLKRQLQVYLGYDREKISAKTKLMSYNLTVPRFLIKDLNLGWPFYPHKPHLALIRDIIVDLASVGSYGRLVDKLWRIQRWPNE